MKNKLLGFAIFSYGLVQTAFPVAVYYLVIPRIYKLYSELSSTQPNTTFTDFGMIFLFLFGIVNVIVGFILILGKGNKDLLFKVGILLFFANFVFGGLISGLVMISILSPIYSMGSKF